MSRERSQDHWSSGFNSDSEQMDYLECLLLLSQDTDVKGFPLRAVQIFKRKRVGQTDIFQITNLNQ